MKFSIISKYFRLGSYISYFLLNRLEKQHGIATTTTATPLHKQITTTTTTTTAKTTTTATSTIASTEQSLLLSFIEDQGAQAVGFGVASVAYTALGEGEGGHKYTKNYITRRHQYDLGN